MSNDWTTYRTRFLIRAKQLDEPFSFVDCIGREHSGRKGDYLVLSSDGSKRIAPREIFEDIYVPMEDTSESDSIGQVAKLLMAEFLHDPLPPRPTVNKIARS